MKKIIMSLLACLLLSAMAITGFAAENALVLSSVEAAPGETVYMTLSLTEPVVGDSMAITYAYDTNILEPVLGAFSWEQKGLLQDFGKTNNAGVWAAKETTKLEGDICVLAFKVLEKATLIQSKVSCTLIVKNSDQEAGRYVTEGIIYQQCDHQYGQWMDTGSLGHSRICDKCGRSQIQSHNYDDGADRTDASGATVKQFTCIDCKAYKQIQLNQATGNEEIIFSNEATGSASDSNGGSQSGISGSDNYDGHDHDADSVAEGTVETADPTDPTQTGHEHTRLDQVSTQEDGGDPAVTAVVILAAAAVLVTAAVLLLKKKK